MKIRIEITGSQGRRVEHIADVTEEGDLPAAVGVATAEYRKLYNDAPLFDYHIRVSNET